jgi:hypothetical protein
MTRISIFNLSISFTVFILSFCNVNAYSGETAHPALFESIIGDYLIFLTKYSNKHFFLKDTIYKYKNLEITKGFETEKLTPPTLSLFGELNSAAETVISVFGQAKSLIASAFSSFSGLFGVNKNSQQPQRISLMNDVGDITNLNKNITADIFSPNNIIPTKTEPSNLIIKNSPITEQPTINNLKGETKNQQTIQGAEEIIQKEKNGGITEDIQATNNQVINKKIVFRLTSGNSGSSNGGNNSGSSSGSSSSDNPHTPEATKTYPLILITEVQLASTSSVHDEFVELYNPNNESVDLTNWYIQKKTQNSESFSTFAKADLFNGKIVAAKSFILIAHSSSTFSYDIAANYGISANNTLVVKNPNGEIVDKVGWGQANDCEEQCVSNPADGQSIQRKLQDSGFIDTGNNASDFEIQTCSSPKTQSVSCAAVNSETGNSTSTSDGATVDHIVISEIYPDKTGNNFDFIEIYNPTNAAVILTDYSLKIRKEAASSTSPLASFSASHSVVSKGFFLVGLDNYGSSTYSAADVLRPSYSLLTSTSSIVFLMNKAAVIDETIYNPLNLSNGRSLERKAFINNQCASAQNSNEFSGNGCDTDSRADFSAENGTVSDWEIRSNPNPQNSQNFPEPRSAPTTPQNFNITYSSDEMILNLRWDASQDYSGVASGIVYKITDTSSSSALSIIETTSTAASVQVSENNFGKTYSFSIQAFDKENLNSAASTATVAIPNSTLVIAYQSDKSASEQGAGNGQFHQYLGNGLLGSPKNIVFHASFLSDPNNPSYYFNAAFWQSDNPDYSNLIQVSSNTCYRAGGYGQENNCPDFGFEFNIDKDYIIPVQQNFTFYPDKYYKITFYVHQSTAVFYGSSDVNSYNYGKATRDDGSGSEAESSIIKDLFFKIEAISPIKTSSDVDISKSVPQNFEANYSASASEIFLNWDKPRYFDENSPALTYRIVDNSFLVSSSTSVLPEINTSATSTKIIITEVGRKYKFSVQAFTDSGGSTLSTLGKDVFIPYSLSSRFTIAQQPDYSVSETGAGNGEFFQTLGNNISGKLGAIAIKAGPPGLYISVSAYQYSDLSYSVLENVSEAAFCTASLQAYSGLPCSDYYIDSNTVTVPAKNNFTFYPEKYYKLLFITYQSQSTFYGSPDANSYPNGQSTKNSEGVEIPTSLIQDTYFKILSSTPL